MKHNITWKNNKHRSLNFGLQTSSETWNVFGKNQSWVQVCMNEKVILGFISHFHFSGFSFHCGTFLYKAYIVLWTAFVRSGESFQNPIKQVEIQQHENLGHSYFHWALQNSADRNVEIQKSHEHFLHLYYTPAETIQESHYTVLRSEMGLISHYASLQFKANRYLSRLTFSITRNPHINNNLLQLKWLEQVITGMTGTFCLVFC